jgi:hypothetical protein
MTVLFNEFQDYLARLCAEHIVLQHSPSNASFSRMMDDNAIDQIKRSSSKNFCIVSSFYGRGNGRPSDDLIHQYAYIIFASYAGAASNAPTIALDDSMHIMMDFISRMHQDSEGDEACGILRRLNLEELTFEELDDQPILDNHYGWVLMVPFKTTIPSYNPQRWTNASN